MAVTSFGTPVMTRATSGSVTATWGTGQNRTAGHLLIAAVSAGGSTASAAAISTPAGWTQQVVTSNVATTANAWVAVYTKVAAGGDSAPAFTATLTGTVAMTVTLLELAAANDLSPVDTSGTYGSGGSSGTLSSMTVTTAANVSVAGEYAVTVYCQEAAAATNTWNGGGSWTNAANDGATNSVLHTAVDYQANPASAGTLSETGHWTTDTSAFGTAIIVAFGVQSGALELFTNDAATSITSGGGDAPAAGTAELWTAASWSAFPTASPTTTPPTTFHIADPGASSELIQVVNTSTGLVMRGAEGTAPVSHSNGFTVRNVISAGQSGTPYYNVRSEPFNAKGNGSTNDTAAIQAALTAAATAGGGTVYVPPGTYVTGPLTIGSYVQLHGDGVASILLAATGAYSSGQYMLSLANPATATQVLVRDLMFNGNSQTNLGGVLLDNTGYSASGVPSHVLDNVNVYATGGDGFHFDNNARGMVVSGCQATDVFGNGFYLGDGPAASGAGATDSSFVSCITGPSAGHGFYLVGGWNNYFSSCKAFYSGFNVGNSTWDTTSCCFEITSGCNNTVFTGCSGQNGALHGFDLQGCAYISVTGCEVDSNSSGGSGLQGCGINTNGATNCSIIGNTGYTSGGLQYGAIQVAGVQTGTVFMGNTIAGDSGTLSYVSGYGYLYMSSAEMDLSGVGDLKLPSTVLSQPGSTQTLTNGSTISTASNFGLTPVTAASNVTGIILGAPNNTWSQILVNNESASFSVTFAAAGTSGVAGGAAVTLGPNACQLFVYDGTESLWYPTGSPVYTASSGNAKYYNNTDANTYNTGQLTLYTSGPQTVATTAVTNAVTGLTCPVGSLATYRISGVISYGGTAVAGTPIFAFTGPTTSMYGVTTSFQNSSTTLLAPVYQTSLTNPFTGPIMTATSQGTTHTCRIEGIATFSAAGTFATNAYGSVATDPYIIQTGSFLDIMPVG